MTNIELKEAQMVEALLRMKKLGIHSNAINEFRLERKINKSIPCRIGNGQVAGILYWLDEEEIEIVKKVEEEKEILVYHVVYTYSNFGKMMNMFYVSKYTEEWEYDNALLLENTQCVYVKNLDEEEWSEFGYIYYDRAFGGIVRTA